MNDSSDLELRGELNASDDGSFMVFDGATGSCVRAHVDARKKAVALEGDRGAAWIWTVTLGGDANVEHVDLDDAGWSALFSQPDQRGEAPSVHNSWCRECPSVGISHGVCC